MYGVRKTLPPKICNTRLANVHIGLAPIDIWLASQSGERADEEVDILTHHQHSAPCFRYQELSRKRDAGRRRADTPQHSTCTASATRGCSPASGSSEMLRHTQSSLLFRPPHNGRIRCGDAWPLHGQAVLDVDDSARQLLTAAAPH